MRQLRFVKQGEDADHIVLEAAQGGEQFSLVVDSALRDAVRSDLPRLNPVDSGEPKISPREIQTRVRAGESPESIAEEHDISVDRVMRFASAVLAERARITEMARHGRARRDGEGTLVIFGEVVDGRFAAHGISPHDVEWDARRREDGQWLISASWIGGDEVRTAEWSFTPSNRQVSAVDDTAGDLLSDRPIRPIVSVPEEPARPVVATAARLSDGVVAFPAMPDADTGELPRLEEVFDQTQFADEASSDAPEELQLDLIPEEPDPASNVTDLGVARRDENTASGKLRGNPYLDDEHHHDADHAERARIPSWDDILLGVRRKSD